MNKDELELWAPFLKDFTESPCWSALGDAVENAYADADVFPPRECLFAALKLCSPADVRVIILGQDPYHEPGQAHGLAFSVREGTKLPPSLRNIFTELQSDLGITPPETGDLTKWAQQGVLLLNTVLTVESGKANSHKDFGWQAFTDAVMSATAALPQPIACVLWGSQAQKKQSLLLPAAGPRLILKAPHPSPLSSYRGFFGSKPFSQINTFLSAQGECPVDWQL